MNDILAVNTIIEWLPLKGEDTPLLERILWADSIGEQVVVMRISKPKDSTSLPLPIWKTAAELTEAIAAEHALRRTVDPYAHLANPDPAFLEKHQGRLEKSWLVIQDLVIIEPEIYLEDLRGPLIMEATEKHRTSANQIYKFLKRYWRGGKMKFALLPDFRNSGGRGKSRLIKKSAPNMAKRGRPRNALQLDPEMVGINVDEKILAIFKIAINLYYDTDEANPLQKAYDEMIAKHFNVGYVDEGKVHKPIIAPASQIPSIGQFRYWYRKERNLTHSLIKREGEKSYALRRRPVLGDSTQMAFGPGSIYQIDATIGDVYLVSSLNRHWIIGRPVIYFVVDTFSRMVVGLYVGLEGPSWIGAMMALANAAMDKVVFCRQYGIEITEDVWPCHFLCEKYLADRGELIGLNSDNLVNSLNITLANCPPYRADWKGIVEQMFRKATQKTIRWLPGGVRKRERGDADHRLDATLDLHQFTKIVIHTMLEYNLYHRIEDYPLNRDMIADEVSPLPIDLWEWGIANRAGHLREKSQEIIRLNLMPTGSAAVTSKGIKFHNVYYTTERALREDWYVRSRMDGRWSIPVSFDPRRMEVIYYRTGNDTFEPCQLLEKDERFAGIRLEEVQDFFALEDMKSDLHEGRRLQGSANRQAEVEAVVAEAKKMKEAAGPSGQSNAQRTGGIRENRAGEKERNRREEGFDLRPESAQEGPGKVLLLRRDRDSQSEDLDAPSSTRRREEYLDILEGDEEDEP